MVLLGKELGWPHETLVQAEEAAYLHDIGKIAISDRVLLKPSRLNTREWELMRQHPSFSADIIGALFAPELVAAVRHHHERWDGDGYPDGLAGDAIPALAQAMCIVDSYDAMSSWRPYRSAMTYSDCLLELERCRGSSSTRASSTPSDACSPSSPRCTAAPARSPVWPPSGSTSTSTPGRGERRHGPPGLRRRRGHLARRARRQPAGALSHDHRRRRERSRDRRRRRRGAVAALALGEPVLVDDELQAVFAGRQLDINVVVVDEWGAWVSGIAPLRDADGAIVAVVNADLPADVAIRLEGLRGDLSETFASLVHSAALRFSRAEVDAITDGLTGIYNHRYLHERLAEEFESAAERQGELTLLFCDLDHFKQFNDRFGHSAGDAALRGVAQIIEGSIRHVDLAARYGGEEFAVILVDTGAQAGMRVAERIRRRVAARPPRRRRPADDQHRHGHLPLRRRQPPSGDRPGRCGHVPGQAPRPRPRGGLLRRPGVGGGVERDGDDAVAPARPMRLAEARERLATSRADMLAFVAGEVAARLGLSEQAVAEVAVQARERALAGGGRAAARPPPRARSPASSATAIVAAVVAAGDLLADQRARRSASIERGSSRACGARRAGPSSPTSSRRWPTSFSRRRSPRPRPQRARRALRAGPRRRRPAVAPDVPRL